MNQMYFLIILVALLNACSATSSEKELLLNEEFNGSELNTDIWSLELGDGCPNLCGWGNREAQVYTDSNHTIKNGLLVITAKKEDSLFTSTRLKTQNKFSFQYGTIEMRAKLPSGKGTWPAFWLLGENIKEVGWPKCGEVDIMEFAGKDPHTIHTTLHNKASYGNSDYTASYENEAIATGFHTYTANWDKDKIEFFIDDELIYTYQPEVKNEDNWPYDQPFFVLLNFAVGGHFGGFEIDEDVFPQEFVIDYVKVWK